MGDLYTQRNVVARKEYLCSACVIFAESRYGEKDVSKEDWAIIQKAQKEMWSIKKGDLHVVRSGFYDGSAFRNRSRIDMDNICIKYDHYDNK